MLNVMLRYMIKYLCMIGNFFNPLGCFQPIPPTVASNADETSLVMTSKCLGLHFFLLIFFNSKNRVIIFLMRLY